MDKTDALNVVSQMFLDTKNNIKIAAWGRLVKWLLDQPSAQQCVQADGGSVPVFDGESLMECGHEMKFIVYSERRNYCAVCGADAHPVGRTRP